MRNKRLFLWLFPIVFLSELAQARIGVSNIRQDEQKIEIDVSTEIRPSMCSLEVTELSLVKPTEAFGRMEAQPGMIKVTFRNPLHQYCLMAFGPHRGRLVLEKGNHLPKLQKGSYRLMVNGEEQEILEVD